MIFIWTLFHELSACGLMKLLHKINIHLQHAVRNSFISIHYISVCDLVLQHAYLQI